MVLPGMVYISQPTEYGTIYSKGPDMSPAPGSPVSARAAFISTCTSVASCHFGTGRTITATLDFSWQAVS